MVARDPGLEAIVDALARDEVAALEAASALVLALPAVGPARDVRRRLEDALAALVRPGRFEAFAAQVAALFDVTLEKARMFTAWIEDPARWEPSPVPLSSGPGRHSHSRSRQRRSSGALGGSRCTM